MSLVQLGTIPKGLLGVAGGVRNRRTSQGQSNNSIVEIGQNAEKSPGDLKILAVS